MKKIFTYFVLFIAFVAFNAVNAQTSTISTEGYKGPNTSVADVVANASRSANPVSVNALYDIQFNYPLAPQIPGGTWVGVCYTGTEFWVTPFNRDSIYTLSPAAVLTNSFRIAGVGDSASGSGVRGMTYDGTNIYASDNTKIIKIIDPVAKTRIDSITVTTPFGVQGITWDSTANAGAGGLWVSNFGTGIYLVSMAGAVLDSIGSAKHGLKKVCGIAFDPYTAGGPYIWAYDQSTLSSANLVRITRATGFPNPVLTHNTQVDIGGGSGLAGGLSITWRYNAINPGKTILGIQQNTGRLFGYELNDQNAIDATADTITFSPPYTQLPTFEAVPFTWTVKGGNVGSSLLTDIETAFTLNDGTSNVFAPAVANNPGVAPGVRISNSFGPYTPAVKGTYTARAMVNTRTQTDQSPLNDTVKYNMFITDTVIARDNSVLTGAVGIGGGGGILGQYFDITNSCLLSSVTFYCNRPTTGDSTSVIICPFVGYPDSSIHTASTGKYYFTIGDAASGVLVTLPIAGGPVTLSPGQYFIGVREYSNNVSLGTTSFNFQPNTSWIIYGGGAWTASENFLIPFKVTFILRANLLDISTTVAQVADHKFGIYPNPASSTLTIESYSPNAGFKVEVYDIIGKLVKESSSVLNSQITMDVSSLNEGIYLVKTIVDGKESVSKVSITR